MLVLVGIVAAVLVMAIGGVTAGPAVAGDDDDDGGVFPVFDVIWGDDGTEEVALSLEANRTSVEAGEAVAFSVSTSGGDPVRNATVSVAGASHAVDDEGRVVVSLDEPGNLTARASGPDTDETVYPPDEVRVAVEPRRVDLAVRTNRSPATAGEPLALRLHRGDTGATVDGELRVWLVAEPGHVPFDRAPAATLAPGETFVPERAGLLVISGTAEADDVEFDPTVRYLAVERRPVALSLSPNRTAAVAGEPVTVRLTRADTGAGVPGTVVVTDPTGERRTTTAAADGWATVAVDQAGTWSLEATAEPTPAVRFVPDVGGVTVERRVVDLVVDLDRREITAGGSVRLLVRRTDDGSAVPATVEVGDRTVEVGDEGVEVAVETPGEHAVRATRADTPAATFDPAETTLSVANTTIALGDVDAPASVAPGESFTASVHAENVGDERGADALVLAVAGEDRDSTTVELSPGESTTATLAATAPEEPGTYELSVRGSDGTHTTTLVVEAS